jgi:hypothetical protein
VRRADNEEVAESQRCIEAGMHIKNVKRVYEKERRRGSMKRTSLILALILTVSLCSALSALSQDDAEDITIRTLPIEYYAASSDGVKILYRGFDNTQRFLYLPKSFEGKGYRFVMAPKGVATGGLPALIVRMRGNEVIYVDIYTRYLRSTASIADFDEEDLEQFEAVERKGTIELEF